MSRIAEVLEHYFPGAELPPETKKGWVKTLCPSHTESRPSATINHELNAVKCFACGLSGDWVKIIMEQEGVTYRAAITLAAGIVGESDEPLSRQPSRQSSRPSFRGAGATTGGREEVPSWVRRATFTRP